MRGTSHAPTVRTNLARSAPLLGDRVAPRLQVLQLARRHLSVEAPVARRSPTRRLRVERSWPGRLLAVAGWASIRRVERTLTPAQVTACRGGGRAAAPGLRLSRGGSGDPAVVRAAQGERGWRGAARGSGVSRSRAVRATGRGGPCDRSRQTPEDRTRGGQYATNELVARYPPGRARSQRRDSAATRGSASSRPRSRSSHRAGIAVTPSRSPAIPPATHAVVSVSSPSAIAAFTTAS